MAKVRSSKRSEAETAPAVQATTDLAAYDFGDHLIGKEEVLDKAEKKEPWLKLLQTNNDETNSRSDSYVDGAKPGMFMHTGSQELFDEVHALICYRSYTYKGWPVSEDDKSGPEVWADNDPFVLRTLKASPRALTHDYTDASGKPRRLSSGFDVMLLLLNPDGTPHDHASLGVAKTKIKPYRAMTARLDLFSRKFPNPDKAPPVYCYRVVLTSKYEKNAKGDFFNIDFGLYDPESSDDVGAALLNPAENMKLLQFARELGKKVSDGEMKIDHEGEREAGTGARQGPRDNIADGGHVENVM